MANEQYICPLCFGDKTTHYHRDNTREYQRCARCALVFVPPHYHLTPAVEKAQYDLHQNDPTDQGYRTFLNRLASPLLERIPAQAQGLDFGSGPGPTLSVMMEEHGHRMRLYDIFYADDRAVFEQTYDVITATEVVEHLAQPYEDLRRLWTCLRPQGWLGIMTKQVTDADAFATWHYKLDPTHISFFSRTSFEWLAQEWGADLTFIGSDVILLQKTDAP